MKKLRHCHPKYRKRLAAGFTSGPLF